MIKKAKVSLSSVIAFKRASANLLDYSAKLEKGVICLEELLELMNDTENALLDNISNMSHAQESVAIVIRKTEEELTKLENEVAVLESEASYLQSELNSMSRLISYTDSEGETHEFLNPSYVALQSQIDSLRSQIAVVREKMMPFQSKLNCANKLLARLTAHIDKEKATVYSISEKRNYCKQIIQELNDLKNENSKSSSYAKEDLTRISKLIEEYLKVKMGYGSITTAPSVAQGGSGITININIGIRTNDSSNNNTPENAIREYSASEIEEHRITFGQDNRVSSYDGLSFGGKYNSYKDRLGLTPIDDNEIRGRYEGIRGESKFIPSNRTVDGIRVIEALQKYGLDGIEYRNAEPDFSPCAEVTLTINHMTENRDDYRNETGEQVPGNFSQADEECARLWNFDEKDGRTDWTPEDVYCYRKDNGLTWHEKCDTKTMQMIPWVINDFFKHLGGCSECRVRDNKTGENQNEEGEKFDE